MMTQFEVLSQFRRRIGNPPQADVNDTTLLAFMEPHLLWLADELEYNVVTAPTLGLTSGDYQYPLPSGCLYILWAEWNGSRLTPGSIAAWTRDNVDWRGATASTPTQYTVEGRTLLVQPPPGDDAVEEDPFLVLCYVAEGSLTTAGVAGLTDSDLWAAIYRAAGEWLGMNPGDTQEKMAANAMRLKTNSVLFEQHFRQAKQRREKPIATEETRFRVQTRRQGAAR
jgi:hypothetical protein